MDSPPCIFLGIKVKPGPIERHKLENYALDNTVDSLKAEAEKKANIPSASLELIHHGKILKDDLTLQDSGVKIGEMVHVVKKKVQTPPTPAPVFTDTDLLHLNAALRTLGCTPNAPGWTRAMQLLNDESAMAEIVEHAPTIGEDCVALSMLHEVELLAALGANIHTMRRGANAHPELPAALRHLTRLVRSRNSTTPATDNVPTSGFAYSLEALSEDEDADEEENEESERSTITQEQFSAALQAATDAITSSSSRPAGSQDSLLRLLQTVGGTSRTSSATEPGTPTVPGRPLITPEMFSEAISAAINRTGSRHSGATPMDQSNAATQELARMAASIVERDRVTMSVAASPPSSRDEQQSPENHSQANSIPGITRTEDAAISNSVRALREYWLGRSECNYAVARREYEERFARPQGLAVPSERAFQRLHNPISHGLFGSIADRPIPNDGIASSSQSPAATANNQDFSTQLQHMHEMGLLDDALNIRALLICTGDVNAAINLVFSGAIGDE